MKRNSWTGRLLEHGSSIFRVLGNLSYCWTQQWSVAMEAVNNASTLCRKENKTKILLCYHDA